MEREQIAAILLRELWRHYDHGGHSGRSWRALLLETVLFYERVFLEDVFATVRAAGLFKLISTFPPVPEQLRLFVEVEYANDEEMLRIVLWGLGTYYRDAPEPRFVEVELVEEASKCVGMPTEGGSYRESFEREDPWELIRKIRNRRALPSMTD